jgi:hypothetical protein
VKNVKGDWWVLMIEHPALVETNPVGVVKVDMGDVWIHICCKLQIITEREKPATFDSAFGLIELGFASVQQPALSF